MKKAKAHMVSVTNYYPRRLVMNAETPYQAYATLKAKYSVAKNRQDFTSLDTQWNEFKVTDVTVDLDKIFTGWKMQSKINKLKNKILMSKGKDKLTFEEKKKNLFYCLRARVVEEILVAKYYNSAPAKEQAATIVSDDEDSDDEDDGTPPLVDRMYDSSDDEDSDEKD